VNLYVRNILNNIYIAEIGLYDRQLSTQNDLADIPKLYITFFEAVIDS